MTPGLLDTVFGIFGGQLRTRRNIRDMTTTLNRIKPRSRRPDHPDASWAGSGGPSPRMCSGVVVEVGAGLAGVQ